MTVRKRKTHLKKVTKNCTKSMMLLCCEKAIWEKGQSREETAEYEKLQWSYILITSPLFSCLHINKHLCDLSQRLTSPRANPHI